MASFEKTICIDDAEFEVTFSATAPVSAYTSGLPEDCYPAEGGDIDIEEVKLADVNIMTLLSEECMTRITDKINDMLGELFEHDYGPEDDEERGFD